jgi:hypothetical protein
LENVFYLIGISHSLVPAAAAWEQKLRKLLCYYQHSRSY